MWWDEKFKRDEPSDVAAQAGVRDRPDPPHPARHLPELRRREGQFDVEGNQIELRYAFATTYNEIPWNPVLYLEWYPRKQAQDRAEIRLLMGGDLGPTRPLGGEPLRRGQRRLLQGLLRRGLRRRVRGDRLGQLAGRSNDWLRLGAEAKGGVDQHGSPRPSTPRPWSDRTCSSPTGRRISSSPPRRSSACSPRIRSGPAVRHRRLAVLGVAPGLRLAEDEGVTPDPQHPTPERHVHHRGGGGRGLGGVLSGERPARLDPCGFPGPRGPLTPRRRPPRARTPRATRSLKVRHRCCRETASFPPRVKSIPWGLPGFR